MYRFLRVCGRWNQKHPVSGEQALVSVPPNSAMYRSTQAWAFMVLHVLSAAASGAPPSAPEALPDPVAVASHRIPWSLSDLQSWAERHSPDLGRAAAEVQVQRGRAWQAGLYPNPEIQGGTNQLNGQQSQYFAMLSQEIVTKHKLQLDQAAVCREVAQAELMFVRARFDLLTNVRQAFYLTLSAQRRRDALQGLIGVARRFVNAAKSLERGGDGTRGDTLLLELELERADFALQNSGVALTAAFRQLSATLGDPELAIHRVGGDLTQSLPDFAYELTQAGLLARNSTIQSAHVEVEKNQVLLQRATVQPIPNVTVQAGFMYEAMKPHDLAIVQLSLPLPIWNKNQGNIQAASANIQRATHAARKTEVDLTKQLAAVTGRYEVARQQVAKFESSILPKAKEVVEITERGFGAGQFDLLRVLQSQRALIESELSYVSAQEARWTAAAEIAGLIQEEQFPPPVSTRLPKE